MAQGQRNDSSPRVILLIDNYDSFVYNLARYFVQLGQQTRVVRHDRISVDQIRALAPAAIVLSPGPRAPQQAGICLEVVRRLHGEIPILGVCLGHQVIGAAFGAAIVRAPHPMHGRTSPVLHDNRGLFAGIPQPLRACRYHSLVISPTDLPSCLEVSAWTEEGTIMGVRHRQTVTEGLQFHPESVLTQHGYRLLLGFLQQAGLSGVQISQQESSAGVPTCEVVS